MKQYNSIEEVPTNELNKPRLFNGTHLLVFDSIAEHDSYLQGLRVWNKEAYVTAISAAVDEIVSLKLLELNYTNFMGEPSVGDVAAGVANNEAEWHLEAIEVNKWYASVYSAMYSHLSEVTEQTTLSTEDFIASLPQLQLPE